MGEMTEKDLEQYLYEQSLRIEPRHSKPVKFVRAFVYLLMFLCNKDGVIIF